MQLAQSTVGGTPKTQKENQAIAAEGNLLTRKEF